MARYRIARASIRIIDTSGEEIIRPVLLYFDAELGEFGGRFVGESKLKGYRFQLSQSSLKYVRDEGTPVNELPRLV
jgi:hypothetical protein